MKRFDELKKGASFDFIQLFDGVMFEPHKVPDIVKENPDCLSAVNIIGENVLHYCVVENMVEEVRLLRSVGSPIPSYALSEAVGLGYTEMVGLLLELGVEPVLRSCKNELMYAKEKQGSRVANIISRHFADYGYEL